MLRPLLANDAVELVFDPPDAELVLETDETKVAQILEDLVSNALKFTERGEVRIGARADDDHVVFEVKDTGIGMALARHLAELSSRRRSTPSPIRC